MGIACAKERAPNDILGLRSVPQMILVRLRSGATASNSMREDGILSSARILLQKLRVTGGKPRRTTANHREPRQTTANRGRSLYKLRGVSAPCGHCAQERAPNDILGLRSVPQMILRKISES